jgi:crossover junction endodeoxyribonuclease RuvC
MKVLAIDPGFGRCGVAILEGGGSQVTLHYSSCIETPSHSPFPERLRIVGDEVLRLIKEHTPDTVVLEELYFANNAKTALRVAEARGALIHLAATHDLSVVELNPSAIKIALTGRGRATKEEVTKMVEKLVRLPNKTVLDDEYDAIAAGITALAEERHRAQRGK